MLRCFAAATSVAIAATFVGGCSKKDAPAAPAASAVTSASAAPADSGPPVLNALPVPDATVRGAVNSGGLEPYTGPTGTVRGVVTVKGDQAPLVEGVAEKIPDSCKDARLVYGRLFREGMMRSLGDALVTVIGYKAYLPVKDRSVLVTAKGCSFGPRTIAMTFGQALEVQSKDGNGYVPRLLRSAMKAEMVATPGGSPVKLYPQHPGRFELIDSMHLFMQTDVFVLTYPTATVTGLDGKYEIQNVPVGDLEVHALLPATGGEAHQKFKLEAGKVAEVNLEIDFDKKTQAPPEPKQPKPGEKPAPVIK